jgi:hypothetical protein
MDSASRVGRLLTVLALTLASFLLLALCFGYEARNQALEPTDEGGAVAGPLQTALIPDPRVAVMMEQITASTLLAYERALTGEDAVIVGGELYTITTRHSYSGEPISRATRYAFEHFERLGLDVGFHSYTYSGHSLRNVVAERQGLRRPDEVYLITAHLDDMPPGPIAPGADDNASGSTAVLAAADLLRAIDFDCTLRFVLFTGEEQHLLGSAAYAADIAAAGDDVRGVLNLDMIGYNSDALPIVDLHARSAVFGSLDIAQTFSQVVGAYDLDLIPDILLNNYLGDYSDNKSFWDRGYPAILAIEDSDDFTPHYHTIGDSLDTLDLDYYVEFVRAGIATFAHMGCLSTGLLTGTVTSLNTGAPLPATVIASALDGAYGTIASADGQYTLTLPIFTFTVQANMPRYMPSAVTGVAILTEQSTVQHFALEPWPYEVFIPMVLKRP